MAMFQESKQVMQPRQVAYIVNVKDIQLGKFIKEDGWNPSYVKIGCKNVARVNIIGAVIELKDDGNFQSIILDDGTGKISIRNFEKKIDADIGDIILLIGRIRQFGNDKYIVPEIVKKNTDMRWGAVWKKTAIKDEGIIGKINSTEESIKPLNDGSKHTTHIIDIVSRIKDLDDGSGVLYGSVVKNTADEKIISSLLLRGDIFEIKPGKLKVLD